MYIYIYIHRCLRYRNHVCEILWNHMPLWFLGYMGISCTGHPCTQLTWQASSTSWCDGQVSSSFPEDRDLQRYLNCSSAWDPDSSLLLIKNSHSLHVGTKDAWWDMMSQRWCMSCSKQHWEKSGHRITVSLLRTWTTLRLLWAAVAAAPRTQMTGRAVSPCKPQSQLIQNSGSGATNPEIQSLRQRIDAPWLTLLMDMFGKDAHYMIKSCCKMLEDTLW